MDFLRSGLRPSLRKSTVFYHKVTAILILFQLAIAICVNKIIKKLPEFIQNIIDRLFNQCNIDLKHFKQQYDPEVKRKEESRFKGFNLFNKKEIEKATKHINDKMDEYAEEFYSNKKQKDDDLSL